MPPTRIRAEPTLNSFTALSDHQSRTPESFFDAKPVLHYHAVGAQILVPDDQASKLPIYDEADNAGQSAGREASLASEELKTEMINIFVTSENVTLFNIDNSTGVEIPYPSIALHAIQPHIDPSLPGQHIRALYMQLDLDSQQDGEEDEETDNMIDITILLPSSEPASQVASYSIQALFDAISTCSNLHPDPTFQEDEAMEDGDDRDVWDGGAGHGAIEGLPGALQGVSDGGLPPPLPGSGGWITADNVGEYFDADGNWIGVEQEELGEGAGRVRGRDELEGDHEITEINGHGTDEDHKRSRTG